MPVRGVAMRWWHSCAGHIESLNVSVAQRVLYEAVGSERQ